MEAEISSNFVYDGRKIIRFHGELRKTSPVYKSRGIFSASKQRIQAISTTVALNFKGKIYNNGGRFEQFF
jgi:hypothetical protein